LADWKVFRKEAIGVCAFGSYLFSNIGDVEKLAVRRVIAECLSGKSLRW
jgi:hypothetical protein